MGRYQLPGVLLVALVPRPPSASSAADCIIPSGKWKGASGTDLAEEAVRRARYQPERIRSFGGQRYGLRPSPASPADVRPHIYPMIEDRRGFEDVANIARVKGIAGLHIGPVDLGLGLGLDQSDARFADALKRIVAAGHAAGVPVIMHAVRGADVASYQDFGFDEFVLTADIELIRSAFQTEVEDARREQITT